MQYQGRDIRVLVVFPDLSNIGGDNQARDLKIISMPGMGFLPYAMDEVENIRRLLDADLLSGKRATLSGLIDQLAPGYDIVWLITHGQEEGWYLSDGLVSASETTALIRSCGAWLTVMNSCSSEKVARSAAREIGSAFICTVIEVPDRVAFTTGVLFAQKLAAGYTYRQAYDLAKPGQNRIYELIEGTKRQMPPVREPDREYYDKTPIVDPDTVMQFIKSVEEMDIIVNGSPRLGIPGIRTSVLGIETDLKGIKVELAEIKTRQRFRNWLIWGFGLAVIVLSATQGILLFLIMSH